MQLAARKSSGAWAWLLQRVTALLLLGLLGIHIAVIHFVRPEGEITFASVHIRLATLLYMVVDYSLLGIVLYHGLNGARNVLLDFTFGVRAQKAISTALLLVGLVAFVYGAWALTPFITGAARP
ncbi:MAG: succinate dehydrogenase/fumarate reductase transmembrane subunit [Chloroflexota bacterium]